MPKQNQANEVQQDKKNRAKVQPPALSPDLTAEKAGLPPLPDSLLAAGANSIEAQAARLGDSRLQTAQRQGVADQIGRTQGNQHLHRVVASLKAHEAATSAGMSSKPAAGSNGGAALKKSAAGTRPTVARQAEATESLGDDRFDEFLGGSGSPSLAPPPPPPDKNGQKMAIQRDGPSRPPLPNFTLTTPSLLQPPDPASRYRLGGDQTLHLDPEIQAMLHQHVQQQLAPANLRDALSQIQLESLPTAAPGAATTPATASPGASGAAPTVPAGPDTPRTATAGDLMGAILAVPAIDSALTTLQSQALDRVSRDWRNLGTGGQIATVSTLAVIGLGALGGAMSDPTTRQLLVDQLNGRTVPVPGLNWMRLEVNTSADNLMLGMHVDVGQLLPVSWGFGPSSPSAIGGPPTPQPFVPGQRTATDEIGETGPSEDIGTRIQAKAGGGKPLDEAIQRRLEDGLGADMSNVRLHTDREADELAQSVNAVAFTTGQDIFFREGTYNPNSTDGLKLLAHEATHTVQQTAGPVEGTPTAGGVSLSDPGDRFEQAAEQAANSIIQREVDPAEPIETVPTDPVATTEPVVQRFLPLVPILVGAGVMGGIVEAVRRESRSLNEPEINYAKDVFHDSLDYSVITITRGSLMSTGAPRTIGNTIHFTDDYYVGDTMELTDAGRSTLVHEMAHVWQYQHGGWTYAPAALWAQAKAWWKTGSRNAAYDWRSLHNAGTPWADWNPEAQAEAVQDYNEALRKGMEGSATPEDYETLSMLQPYIADMQAGPPPAPEGAEEGEADLNDGGGGAEGGPGYYPPAQRQIDPAPANGLVGVVQRAVIQRAFDLASASETEKIKQISEELSHLGTGTAGAGGARLITDIWNSFGDDIARVAGANIALWEATLKRIDLSTLPAVTRIKAKFKSDVEAVALDYLAQNRAYVLAEMDRMGAYGTDQTEKPTLDQDEQVKEMQAIAAEVARAKQGQQKLQGLQVGWELEETGDVHKPFATEKTPVYFSPGSPPMYRTGPGGATPPASYEECQKEYDSAQLAIDAVASVYPTIFAMVQSGEVTKVEADPGAARQQMGKALQGLQQKIDAAVPKIGSGVDFDDLVPIHGALFGGQMPGASGIRWNEPFYKWVGTSMVSDADTAKLLAALGVGALSAAMFVFASLATGGVATVLFVAAGTAASAGQAALDWKKWNDLSTAAEATVKPELALVTQGQVDMALFTAVVDTLFAFLDLKGGAAILTAPEKVAARQALKAAKAGTRAAIIEGLKDATAPAIERGVAELGAAETIARSGRTAEDLIPIVGKNSETAKRLEPFTKAAEKGTKAALEDVAKKLPRLAEELKGGLPIAEADKLVSLAIDQYGPAGAIRKAGGWKNLSDALGEGTAAGKQLTAWRDAIRRDTFEYIEKELGGSATRTGTEGGFKNDMDISMLGKDAGKNREPARRFMAARAGCSPDELRILLHGDVFIDPTRMLLHATESGLTPTMRATLAREAREYQEGLMNGRRLYLARQHGDDALVKALEEEMASRGVTPLEWKPLSESEISKLAADIDTEMALLEKATEEGEKARLIRSIAQKEATIKASEEGAYATSGGIWRWVFERPGDKGKFGKKALVEMWPDERYTAILAELPSLDHSAATLKYPKDAGELAGALRDLGKHGGRLTEVLGEAAVPKVAGFEELAEWCVRIKKDVDAGLVSEALMVAGEAERFAREAAEKLAQLESASNRGLQLLRERHSFGAMSVDPGAIQAMVSAHVKYLTVRDAIERQLLALRELAQTAARAATANAEANAPDSETAQPAEPQPVQRSVSLPAGMPATEAAVSNSTVQQVNGSTERRDEKAVVSGQRPAGAPVIQRKVLVAGAPQLTNKEFAREQLRTAFSQRGKEGLDDFIQNIWFTIENYSDQDKAQIRSNIEAEKDSLLLYGERYLVTFENSARDTVQEMLKASEAILKQEMARYGIEEKYIDNPDIKATMATGEYSMAANADTVQMALAAKQLIEEDARVKQLGQKLLTFGMGGLTNKDRETPSQAEMDEQAKTSAEFNQALLKYDLLFTFHSSKFPVLAAFKDDPAGMAKLTEAGQSPEAATLIGKTIKEKQDNIYKTRDNLTSGALKIWTLKNVVDATRPRMQANPGSVEAKFVDEQAKKIESDETMRSIALAALGITVGLIGAVATAGGSLGIAAAAATAGAAMSTRDLLETIKNYQVSSAAAGTALDKAKAVAQDDPSLLWVALEIVGLGLDVADALVIFKKLAGPVRKVMTVPEVVVTAKAGETAVPGAEAAADIKAVEDACSQQPGLFQRLLPRLTDPAKAHPAPMIEQAGRAAGDAARQNPRHVAQLFSYKLLHLHDLLEKVQGAIPDIAKQMIREGRVKQITRETLLADFSHLPSRMGLSNYAEDLIARGYLDPNVGGFFDPITDCLYLRDADFADLGGVLMHETEHRLRYIGMRNRALEEGYAAADADQLAKQSLMGFESELEAHIVERDFYIMMYQMESSPFRGMEHMASQRVKDLLGKTDQELMKYVEDNYAEFVRQNPDFGSIYTQPSHLTVDKVVENIFDDIAARHRTIERPPAAAAPTAAPPAAPAP